MNSVKEKIELANWSMVTTEMNQNGYSILKNLLIPADCAQLIGSYDQDELYRKTISMERYRFGLGEYKYFNYPLPDLIQTIRETVYPHLAPIANTWMEQLNIDNRFPEKFSVLQELCKEHGQVNPTVLILKYGKAGYNTLHQDLYGEIFFPLQVVLFLNEPGVDYQGAEFVLLQQIPRAQSKAIVLNPKRGDMLVFTTNFRPAKGSKGYYRVNMKHGVSELQEGERHTLGILFHDALH